MDVTDERRALLSNRCSRLFGILAQYRFLLLIEPDRSTSPLEEAHARQRYRSRIGVVVSLSPGGSRGPRRPADAQYHIVVALRKRSLQHHRVGPARRDAANAA